MKTVGPAACVLMTLVGAVSAEPAATPLTAEDEESLLRHYGEDGTSIARLVGYRYENATAGAEMFGPPVETQKGSCVSLKFQALGHVTGGDIVWTTPFVPKQLEQVVWLPAERKQASCSAMFDAATITVVSPIEESILLRLYSVREELALAANMKLGKHRWPEHDVQSGRLAEISVAHLGSGVTSGTYRIRWAISQCAGISMAIETASGADEFRVVGAWPVVC